MSEFKIHAYPSPYYRPPTPDHHGAIVELEGSDLQTIANPQTPEGYLVQAAHDAFGVSRERRGSELHHWGKLSDIEHGQKRLSDFIGTRALEAMTLQGSSSYPQTYEHLTSRIRKMATLPHGVFHKIIGETYDIFADDVMDPSDGAHLSLNTSSKDRDAAEGYRTISKQLRDKSPDAYVHIGEQLNKVCGYAVKDTTGARPQNVSLERTLLNRQTLSLANRLDPRGNIAPDHLGLFDVFIPQMDKFIHNILTDPSAYGIIPGHNDEYPLSVWDAMINRAYDERSARDVVLCG